jgi:hypothetical protein
VLAAATGCSTRTARRARHGGRVDHFLRGQWPGAKAQGDGRDPAALERFFSTYAASLRPALSLGQPELEGLA